MFGDSAVQSLIDTDFYKLTMQQCYLHQQPDAMATWTFRCRNDEDLSPYVAAIRRELESLSRLHVSEDQLAYLRRHFPFLKADYLEFLRLCRFNPDFLHVAVEGGRLSIEGRGPMLYLSPLEIPVLAAVSEVRNRARYPDLDVEQIHRSTQAKVRAFQRAADRFDLSGFRFTDFGTRRRFSFRAQRLVLELLKGELPDHFVGTSNPHLARELKLRCQGTMAHEWLQCHQALACRLADSQKLALENWAREYRGQLAIALTDVIGVEAFCRDLDLYLARLYTGFRHDSGDPMAWGEQILARLEELRVDPTDKTLVFSDGLDFDRAIAIYRHFQGRARMAFGIGTWLTGDFGVNQPMDMVMKLTRFNGQPVAKISDSPGKTMCRDEAFLNHLMAVFQVSASVRAAILAEREKL
ncbi:nicotinate phosphoribosyltransferase [Gallaecimonas sp. GXIMD4217]|uniref:nicotinate phosphoribosyltransferase n=1 Tax=Gallaecimonas sp. GXIMD4217 TaxID=3131927 RepID=UPI00311AEE9C